MKTYKEALLKYYTSVLELAELSDDETTKNKRQQALEKMINQLTPEEAEELVEDDDVCIDYLTESGLLLEIERRSPEKLRTQQQTRLLSYATAFNKSIIEKKRVEKANDLKMITDAMINYADSFLNEETIVVNGNSFHYDPSKLNIDAYIKELEEIGESSKGNSYAVYLDEEGLVIY